MKISTATDMKNRIDLGSRRSTVVVDGKERRDLKGKTTAEILVVFRAKKATPVGKVRAKIRGDLKRRGISI